MTKRSELAAFLDSISERYAKHLSSHWQFMKDILALKGDTFFF